VLGVFGGGGVKKSIFAMAITIYLYKSVHKISTHKLKLMTKRLSFIP